MQRVVVAGYVDGGKRLGNRVVVGWHLQKRLVSCCVDGDEGVFIVRSFVSATSTEQTSTHLSLGLS